MRKLFRFAPLLVLLLLLCPGLGQAAPVPPMPTQALPQYLAVSGGIYRVADMTIFSGLKMSFQDGYLLSLAAGQDFGAARLEVEATTSDNKVDRVTDLNSIYGYYGSTIGASGDVSLTTLMFNGYLVLRNTSPWKPYAGVGLGFGYLSFNNVRDSLGNEILNDSSPGEVSQVLLGVDYRLDNRLEAGLRLQGQGIFVSFHNQVTGETHNDAYLGMGATCNLRYRF